MSLAILDTTVHPVTNYETQQYIQCTRNKYQKNQLTISIRLPQMRGEDGDHLDDGCDECKKNDNTKWRYSKGFLSVPKKEVWI